MAAPRTTCEAGVTWGFVDDGGLDDGGWQRDGGPQSMLGGLRRSLRSKLLALVLLPVLLLLALLAIAEGTMERQFFGEAKRRVESAKEALQVQFDDDLRDLNATLLQLSASQRLLRTLEEGDLARAQRTVDRFTRDYPTIAVLIADEQGAALVKSGLAGVQRLDDIIGLSLPEEPGAVESALLPSGCVRGDTAPARGLATRIGQQGFMVACQRLDNAFLEHAAGKLGLSLALVDEQHGHRLVAHTASFPRGAPTAGAGGVLHEEGPELWALAEFCPRLLNQPDEACAFEAMTALSVSHTRNLVRSDFLWVILAVAGAGALALALGGRLAFRMTRAIDRMVAGCRRLANAEYAKIEVLRTGDELEELGHGFNHMVEGLEERDRLRTTFGKYMTDTVVSHLLANRVELGGDTLPVTILFSDIRGFTSISEHLDAQSLVALLNEYFTEMVDIVMDHGGVVDKYIGDAIMVVFGAPVPQEDDALRAVQAAVRMREALSRLNERLLARGVAPIRTGVGIHSGEVVAGNIGSERRMEYTVIGDAVNLASRLESSTKELGADIVISDATYALVRDAFPMRFLNSIQVKGRKAPVKVYAVEEPARVEAAG